MNEYESKLVDFSKHPDENLVIESDFNDILKEVPCMMGIDEAGRGPVLGPMVYACSVTPIDNLDELKKLELDDSKVLTIEQRETMFSKMNEAKDKIAYVIEIISPNTISTNMLAKTKINLNAISQGTAMNLIKAVLKRGTNLKEVYVDTVGPPHTYQAYLQEIFPGLKIIVEKKADAIYPIVSGASICAKVTRDRVLNGWKYLENLNMEILNTPGSGYTSDPKTKKFMATTVHKIFGFPQFVRSSWSTAYKIVEKECANVSWEDDEDQTTVKSRKRKLEENETKSKSLLDFYSINLDDKKRRHQFFRYRHLHRVVDLI